MRDKLALTIALTAFAVAVGAGLAGAAPLVEQGGTTSVPGAPPVQVSLPACADGADNDGDGKVDLADPDCVSSAGTSEGSGPAPAPPPTSTVPTTPTTTTPSGGGNSGGSDNNGGKNGKGGKEQSLHDANAHGGPNSGANGNTGGVGPNGKKDQEKQLKPPPQYQTDGTPTVSNPTTTIAPFGPAPVGVPNFVIDQFEIPPFLLPIYQACGTQYGIPWEVLASINKIETAFGTNLNVSTAGAIGWMQFLPSSWKAYGVDANGDGRKDPYNPVDAICAAARYLRAAGGQQNLSTAILAYNHAQWYVDEVLLYARSYGKIPSDLLGSLTGLTEGAHFPVAADARYADDIQVRQTLARSKPGKKTGYGNVADVINSSPTRTGINIYSHEGAPVVAVNDGVVVKIGDNAKLGRYLVLRDAYGNRFTYAQLGQVVSVHPVPKPQKLTASDFKIVTPASDGKPNAPASKGAQVAIPSSVGGQSPELRKRISSSGKVSTGGKSPLKSDKPKRVGHPGPINSEDLRPRMYALPKRPANRDRASLSGQLDSLAGQKIPAYSTFKNYFNDVFGFNRHNTELRPLREGSKVIGGTVLGRIGPGQNGVAPHINFAIRPAGKKTPAIDPKPILDGWKLLEATAIYRAAGKNPFAENASIGQVLLMSKEALERRVLSDPRLSIYSCGRQDIMTGQIDRRVLATLEYLVAKGFRLTITSLKCGHSFLTSSGNVSEHSSGNAVDIAVINGIPVVGHQGPGTLTDALIRAVLQLQGTMTPDQVISLEDLPGPISFPLPDHYDHVHVGFKPIVGVGQAQQQFVQLLKPDQWQRLVKRLGQIQNPTVPTKPSSASLPAGNKKKGGRGGGD